MFSNHPRAHEAISSATKTLEHSDKTRDEWEFHPVSDGVADSPPVRIHRVGRIVNRGDFLLTDDPLRFLRPRCRGAEYLLSATRRHRNERGHGATRRRR